MANVRKTNWTVNADCGECGCWKFSDFWHVISTMWTLRNPKFAPYSEFRPPPIECLTGLKSILHALACAPGWDESVPGEARPTCPSWCCVLHQNAQYANSCLHSLWYQPQEKSYLCAVDNIVYGKKTILAVRLGSPQHLIHAPSIFLKSPA